MRIIPFAREYAESNEFTLAQGQRVTVFLVREDGNPTIGEAWAEIQIKAEGDLAPQQNYDCRTESYSDNPDARCRYTTFHVLNTDQPSYTIHAADGPATYRVVRRDCTPVVGVYRTEIDSDCPPETFSHANQVIVLPENFAWAFATAGAGDAGFIGVFASTQVAPSETVTGTIDFVLGSNTYLKVGVNASGNLVITLGDPGHSGFWAGNYAVRVWGCGFDEEVPVSLTNDEMTYVGGSIPLQAGDHFGVWVGSAITIPDVGPFDFELKQGDLPARLVGYPFQADDSTAQLFAVVEYCESVVYVPLNGRCTTLTGARPMIELTAPGKYAIGRPCAEGTGFFLSTGKSACVSCGGEEVGT